jgi:hypothetical protein
MMMEMRGWVYKDGDWVKQFGQMVSITWVGNDIWPSCQWGIQVALPRHLKVKM